MGRVYKNYTKKLKEQAGKLVVEKNIPVRMSRQAVPQDNQPIESFWKTMKREMPSIRHMKFEQAKATIVEYIELYYNSERLYSSINYRIPNEAYRQLSI